MIAFLLLIVTGCADKYVMMVKTSPLESEWEFKGQRSGKMMRATVPGTVHTDLMNNSVIDDPYFAENELKLQWVEESDWHYSTKFMSEAWWDKYQQIVFVFEGLDTYADVFLNDSLLLRADNMFFLWRADGKRFLKQGENHLRVVFHSPVKTANEKLAAYPHPLPAGASPIAPFIRKAGYHFGWDFSPRILTMGITKPVYITANDGVFIRDIHITTIEIADTCAWMNATVSVLSNKDLGNATITLRDVFKNTRLRKGENAVSMRFAVFNPELWWPNGYGTRKLYDATAKLFVNGYLVDSTITRFGIRKIELVRDEDEYGREFYFRVNGLPIFIKGANYVPQTHFLPSLADSSYERLLKKSAAVGMNMVRVWGGGVYEDERFYQWCDELGIMVWQDFMFANAMYPADSLFRGNILKEVLYQVRRLRNHPSIALWCGNNEMEVAWKYWGWQNEYKISAADSVKISDEYYYLFERVFPAIIQQFDPERPYIPTSPLSNWNRQENFFSHNMHYWGVWHGDEVIDFYRVNIPRFMTEYGMQSLPSFTSLQKNTKERITLNGEFLQHRQRSYKGNEQLLPYIRDYFGEVKNVEELCYLSQLNQAEAMRIAIESHRKNARFCMGSMYWQLNDVWDGASWSTIERSGKWKAAHYALKRLYAPDLLITESDDSTVTVYFVTENTSGRTGMVHLELMDFRGRSLASWQEEITAGYLLTEKVTVLPIGSAAGPPSQSGLLSRTSPLSRNEIMLRAYFIRGNDTLATTNHYFVKPLQLKLTAPTIAHTLRETLFGTVITLETDRLAKGVMLEFENRDGHFSDNYFDLVPGEKKEVVFVPGEGAGVGNLQIQSYLNNSGPGK